MLASSWGVFGLGDCYVRYGVLEVCCVTLWWWCVVMFGSCLSMFVAIMDSLHVLASVAQTTVVQ